MSESSQFGFSVASVVLKDGQKIELPRAGLTVVTGSNNSGKSLFLRDLVMNVESPHNEAGRTRWITKVEETRDGDSGAFFDWLAQRGLRSVLFNGVPSFPLLPGHERPTPAGQIAQMWDRRESSLIARFLITGLWTDTRLADNTNATQWEHGTHPSHPTQLMWRDRKLHDRLSAWVERAFGEKIVINRHSMQIRLQLSTEAEPEETPPPATDEYHRWYRRQPILGEQGDGVRSFVGILLHALVQPPAVVVIDEPEAFLHPPQARLLGKLLAEETNSRCQVIVATHSVDFLHGVLESKPGNTRIIRLSKTAGHRTAQTLAPASVRELLTDPFTRYANIASGFFHDGVVLCEAEGDCRFYSATLEEVVANTPSTPDPNLTFLHVGGKSRLAMALTKLRSVGIPSAVIADIDMLDTKQRVRQLVTALGGEWDRVAPDLETLHRAAGAAGRHSLPVSEVRRRMNEILKNSRDSDALTSDQTVAIAKLAKRSSYWNALKESGTRAVGGDEHNALIRLLVYLGELGAFLVPVGELECWHLGIKTKDKSAWIANVFEKKLHLDPPDELVRFTRQYLGYLTHSPGTNVPVYAAPHRASGKSGHPQ
ncbi:AAA family ATPase [Embleya sp. NPDC050493]|uniref:AAA family ATPase n=1 Tax=Embleya sp. NPDC050493 TaxID=3363989 RepID=UPI0037B2EBBE